MMEERKELVRYRNEMNEIPLQDFASMDLNCLYLICTKVSGRQSDEVEIAFSDIRTAIGYKSRSKDRFVELLRGVNRKLIRCAGHYENEDEIVDFNLFYLFKISKVSDTLTVAVNPKFAYLLNNVAKEFTVFELQEFVGLKHRNSKILYRLLKQWRTQGYTRIYTVDEMRDMLGIEGYENKYLLRNVIKPAMQEIKDKGLFADLTCETVRDEHAAGRPTKGYIFHFKAEKPPKKTVTDKSEGNGSASRRGRKKGFADFEQRQDYDMDGIEQALTGD